MSLAHDRLVYARRLERVTVEVLRLLDTATTAGYRTDCLRVASASLRGALRNVESEDARITVVPVEPLQLPAPSWTCATCGEEADPPPAPEIRCAECRAAAESAR